MRWCDEIRPLAGRRTRVESKLVEGEALVVIGMHVDRSSYEGDN